MKNKLLVLSLGALCVSQIWESNRASAVVSGEENPYVSKALSVSGQKSNNLTLKQYKDSLRSVMCTSEINKNDGYDEPEYKEAMDTYRKKLFAELDALNKFLDEERKIESSKKNNNQVPNGVLGLTHQRYLAIHEAIKENKNEFERKTQDIESRNPDLKKFDRDKDYEVRVKLNELENKVLMLGHAFPNQHEARENLYNKLDLIVGRSDDEREERHPQNDRLSKERVEDLESIIDEFFVEINENRPLNIPALVESNEENIEMAKKLKADTEEAKTNTAKRSKRSLNTQNYKSASQEVSEQQKAEYERKAEERKEKFLAKNKDNPVVSLIDDEDDNENDKQLVVSAPTKKPTSPTTYTETTTQVPMPTVERQTQQQIIYKAPKPLAGLNGESHDFTTTHQSPATSNHTHNHLIEFEETSALPGRKTGSLVGLSQIDSSHLTEREKRVIKREHVREAQKLVDNYKDTHSYKDRLNAQQKVNTLSAGHQKRFNKQINKVYNGK
ncbi:von Willebrand factor binding protein Vwb [Staphylococcus aureus]|uniref:von Willebrand factor binding protein Vwb n=1 Tax=Staphylococcus aureus TaxID=1280 RepID=UPI0001C0BA63|nr:von Willebrand factor binding protein Vwb [Staphylococcus aureus]EFB50427.1 secreted von Willebrand factor-binding protein VWbp [Staphylococcus aureus subsp. aureus D139]EFC07188.1 secreted von Willebrand factor-binding protein VWbp [Staphylococcus aureus subsp. aureus H19]KIT69620.1 coagulase [Staphylococcus aureus]MCB8116064.1 von Willebrand factor binding protein Vwb [Staphylococcus aureus]MCC5279274.1 von Willebrand factor binding protein Vwb [Staphylococcus aureus]